MNQGGNMITAETIVSRSRDVVSSHIDGEAVMMSIERGKYYGMDPIASRIWELVEKPINVGDMIDTLMQEYNVTQEDCEKDVLVFLSDLLAEKLVEIVSR
jgi:hypothetical protein